MIQGKEIALQHTARNYFQRELQFAKVKSMINSSWHFMTVYTFMSSK